MIGGMAFAKGSGIKWGQAVSFSLSPCLPKHGCTDRPQQGLLLSWFAAYGLTVGPIPYIFAAEMPAVKLRSKTINLSRIFYYCCDVVNGVMAPYAIVSLQSKAQSPFISNRDKLCRAAYFFFFSVI